MRVEVSLLTEDLEIAVDPSATWAVEAAASALEGGVRDLRGALRVSAAGARVSVAGSLVVSADAACARCGEQVAIRIEERVDLSYDPTPEATSEGERELDASELDVGFYDAGVLDLADVVAEAVALGLPARVKCEDTAACDERTRGLLEDQPRVPTTFEVALAGWNEPG